MEATGNKGLLPSCQDLTAEIRTTPLPHTRDAPIAGVFTSGYFMTQRYVSSAANWLSRVVWCDYHVAKRSVQQSTGHSCAHRIPRSWLALLCRTCLHTEGQGDLTLYGVFLAHAPPSGRVSCAEVLMPCGLWMPCHLSHDTSPVNSTCQSLLQHILLLPAWQRRIVWV
jgi:hypothetical protein